MAINLLQIFTLRKILDIIIIIIKCSWPTNNVSLVKFKITFGIEHQYIENMLPFLVQHYYEIKKSHGITASVNKNPNHFAIQIKFPLTEWNILHYTNEMIELDCIWIKQATTDQWIRIASASLRHPRCPNNLTRRIQSDRKNLIKMVRSFLIVDEARNISDRLAISFGCLGIRPMRLKKVHETSEHHTQDLRKGLWMLRISGKAYSISYPEGNRGRLDEESK